MRPVIEHQITMEDLGEDLAMHSKGSGHPVIDRIGKSLKISNEYMYMYIKYISCKYSEWPTQPCSHIIS